jgi:hypothetical protein
MLRLSSAIVGTVALLLACAGQTPPAATAAKPVAIIGDLAPGLRETDTFEAPLKVSGGTPPFRWSIVDGELPEGVFLHSRTGLLHGTPVKRGNYRFTVEARDANNASITRTFEYSVLYNPAASGGRR